MKKSYSIILSFAVLMGVNGTGTVFAQDIDEQKLIEVGKKIFFDVNLSVNKTQSCASCHDPATGFTGPDSAINAAGAVEPGAIPERFGNRKPPGVPYTGKSPVMYYDEDKATWFGGMFWDGRATGWILGDPLAEQAMGPFLNPLEMAMPDAELVVLRVAHSDYAEEFEEVWGPGSLDFAKDADASYERIASSIAAYERSKEVNLFTSKFDLFFDNTRAANKDITKITAAGIPGGMGGGMGSGGGGTGGMGGGGGGGMGGPQNNPARWEYYQNYGLTVDELKGLAVFNDASRGNCASCHTLQADAGKYPLFTDFGYYNLGIPKNPDNPYYTMPKKWNPDGENWVDNGLGGYLKAAGFPKKEYEIEMGKHKTPSLRNIDQRPSPEFVRAYGHNGFFKSLDGMEGIIHFYAWRAMMDAGGMGGGGMGGGMGGGGGMGPNPTLFPAPEVDENRITMQPFNFMADGGYLVAFLKTLTDGYSE